MTMQILDHYKINAVLNIHIGPAPQCSPQALRMESQIHMANHGLNSGPDSAMHTCAQNPDGTEEQRKGDYDMTTTQ